MKIRAIHIDGFGLLRDLHYELDGALTVFAGPNEAGKSTLMGFVRAVLFGLPSRQRPTERYEPPHGGAHGGWLMLEDAQGRRWRVSRYAAEGRGSSASSGIVRVVPLLRTAGPSARDETAAASAAVSSGIGAIDAGVFGEGAAGAEGEALLQSLLGGIGTDMYRSLFAFGLAELAEIGSLQSEELSAYLYSAGWGASGRAVPAAERKLAQDMERLFKPRGHNQEVALAVKRLETAEAELRRSGESVAEYNQLRQSLAEAEAAIGTSEQQLDEARTRLADLETVRQARTPWLRLREIAAELERLPDIRQFPEQAVHRLELLRREEEVVLLELDKLERKKSQALERMADLEPREEALAHKAELEACLERLGAFQDAREAVTGLQAELLQKEQELARLAQLVDERWTAADLESCSVTVEDRERIREFRRQARQLELEAERARSEALRLREQAQRAEQTCERLNRQLRQTAGALSDDGLHAALSQSEGQQLETAIAELERRRTHYLETERELKHAAERMHDWQAQRQWAEQSEAEHYRLAAGLHRKWMYASLAAACVLPAALVLAGEWSAAAVCVVALLGAAAYCYRQSDASRRSRAGGRQSRDLANGAPARRTSRGAQAQLASPPELDELSRRHAALEAQAQDAQRELCDACERLAGQWLPRPEAETPPGHPAERAERLIALLRRLADSRRETERAWEQEKRRYEEAKQEAAELRGLAEQSEAARDEWEYRLEQWRTSWESWLGERNWNPRLSPDAALEIVQLVEQGKELLRQKQAVCGKLEAISGQIRSFRQRVSGLLGLPEGADAALELKRWKIEAERGLAAAEEIQSLKQTVGQCDEERIHLEARLSLLAAKIADLLAEGGAGDEEQFRLLAAQYETLEQLRKEQGQLQVILESITGKDGRDRTVALLERHSPAELDRMYVDEQARCRRIDAALADLRERRGRLGHELDKLETDAGHAKKMQQVEEAKAALNECVKRWMSLSLCGVLFKKAKAVYERERQPEVLRRASGYMKLMTDGRYIRIIAPLGEKILQAERANGDLVDVRFLSRGTAEQLYLAMRFALADEYARKTPLPIMLDDILVNFDRERVCQTLRLIRTLAGRHQILLFTCHDNLVETVKGIIPEGQLLTMERTAPNS